MTERRDICRELEEIANHLEQSDVTNAVQDRLLRTLSDNLPYVLTAAKVGIVGLEQALRVERESGKDLKESSMEDTVPRFREALNAMGLKPPQER